MTTGALCDACSELFCFARQDIVDAVRCFKKDDIDTLSTPHKTETEAQRSLRLDLERYEGGVGEMYHGQAPCPWPASYHPNSGPFAESEHYLTVWGTGDNDRPWPAVVTSASNGCFLCETLVGMARYALGDDISESSYLVSIWCLARYTYRPLVLRVGMLAPKEQATELAMQMFFRPKIEGVSSDDFQIVRHEPLGDNSGGPDCIEFLISRFRECTESHTNCSIGYNDGWVPRRLLDLGPRGEYGRTITLREDIDVKANGDGASLTYATVSHVWGSTKPLQLMHETHESLRNGIPDEFLPRQYRDAVFMARKLGLRYLWIDSLCIIQDSQEDWEHQAMEMNKVYSRGLCNLAICDAQHSKQSGFTKRDARTGANIVTERKYQDCSVTFTLIPDWQALTRGYAPLYKRAWVVQERFLSPRVMHLTTFPMWECKEGLFTETYSQWARLKPRQNSLSLGSVGTERSWLNGDKLDSEQLFVRWQRLVETYSACGLAVSNDKLIAFGALAKVFANILKAEYYAGVWGGEYLPRCLLWASLVRSRPIAPETGYQAPSWSWASRNNAVRMLNPADEVRKVLFSTLSIWTEFTSNNPFGISTGGELTVWGYLLSIDEIKARIEQSSWTLYSSLDVAQTTESKDEPSHFLPLVEHGERCTAFLNIKGILLQTVVDPETQLHGRTFRRVGLCSATRLWSDENSDALAWKLTAELVSAHAVKLLDGCEKEAVTII